MKTTTAITAIDKTAIPIKRRILKSPWRDCSSACPIAPGIPVNMLVAIIIDIPFPIPLSETCSPSHIKNMVPATTENTAETKNDGPGTYANPLADNVTARADACTKANIAVPYLVYCVIVFLPAWPSFLSSCK